MLHKSVFLPYLLRSFVFLFVLSSNAFAQVTWTQVPTPNPSASRNMLRGISGTSSSDVWAVGSFEEILSGPPYYVEKDLILHWNGSSWQQYPPMNLSNTLDDLWDVAAVAPNDVWAVGTYNPYSGPTQAEMLHFNGTSWTNYPLPVQTNGSFLYSIDANSPTDIWAGGYKGGSPTRFAYVLHYNGSSWSEVTVPPVGTYRTFFNAVDGLSANDMWGAGYWSNAYGEFNAVAMHWNGSTWINTAMPASITPLVSEILDIEVVSANDVWAVGQYLSGGMFKIHWNGTSWTEITPPGGGGGALKAISANNVYAFGAEIANWNGSSWTTVDNLSQFYYPALTNSVKFANGDIWATGRHMDAAGNIFYGLVYRNVQSTPSFARGTTQSWSALVNSQSSIDTLLKVNDPDISQQLRFSLTSAPSHGTVSGLPASAITNAGIAQPSGVTYTPDAGYTGNDQFTVSVSIGAVTVNSVVNVNVAAVLAIGITDFTAMPIQDGVRLSWTTAQDFDGTRMEVEHSSNGQQFNLLNAVTYSPASSAYSHTDLMPYAGLNYYRLKTVAANGTVAYSPLRTVAWNRSATAFDISPNPVAGHKANLSTGRLRGIWAMELYNSGGQMLLREQINLQSNVHTVNFPTTLPRGLYWMRLSNGVESFKKSIVIE